jgi:MFS family permease
MNAASRKIRATYLVLGLLITLPTALIIGVNTLFLLDGGLSNVEAFAANAIYTLGMVLFEIPTGMVADTWGRRTSYLIGAAVQLVGNLLYVLMWRIHGPFWGWGLASLVLGFGYCFFSGALEAWLVDEMRAAGHQGDLDEVFARRQVLDGAAMLVGTLAGGFIAQLSVLGAPYLARAGIQLVALVVAALIMKEHGFTPEPRTGVVRQVKSLAAASWRHGLQHRPVRWIVLAAPFTAGVGMFAFYASQPYLLQLFGNQRSIAIAGIAAAGISATQIAGGLVVPFVRRRVPRRTHVLLAAGVVTAAALVLMGLLQSFAVVVALLVIWAMAFAATTPVRQAYLNAIIPSRERATVLSFDSMVSSIGGVTFQPILGRVADVWGYAASYVVAGAIASGSIPFLLLARRENVAADTAREDPPAAPAVVE